MHVIPSATEPVTAGASWRSGLPVLMGRRLRLREVRRTDAKSLMAMLTSSEITRFISAPPTTLDGFERFIAWAGCQRAAGSHACFVATLSGSETPIGLFQVTGIPRDLKAAEWGFVLATPFWGTGLFQEAARLLLDFAFETIGVHRLEARAAVLNGRGNGALLKIGAVQEGVLRRSFLRHGQMFDQVLYSIVGEDWRGSHATLHAASAASIH
jgi:RimJ/RimL family protein N-acetyltransferase